MAHLPNDAASMRFAISVVDREARLRGGQPAFQGVPAGRLLATAAVEHFDRRDREWWPFVRLPSLYVAAEAVEGLVEGARQVLAAAVPGFSWEPGPGVPVGLQLGATDGPPGVIVEVGIDLGPWLADVAGGQAGGPAGGEACLFRFAATRADLVRCADALGAEVRGVPEK